LTNQLSVFSSCAWQVHTENYVIAYMGNSITIGTMNCSR
jgi:hypothetical protein